MRVAFVLMFILIFSSATFADFRQATKSEKIVLNPKQVAEARFRIALSGSLSAEGNIDYANLTLGIPQEGVEDVKVTADSWRYVNDDFGNRLVLMEWKNPRGVIQYRVETIATNKARETQEKPIASNPSYLKENDQIRFTPALRSMAFPFERSMRRAAELTTWVHNYVNYDLSLVSQLKPSDWVYENRRGVCVEYANLLVALLKISGIPTRYIVGYAYSTVEQKLIGHTWVEILSTDGTWIPLDPTWLEAGYLDATHVKTAVREDANQTEKLAYSGNGKINIAWNRNEDEIELLSYRAANVTDISLAANGIATNEYGLAKATISAKSCTIADVNMTSCTGESGRILNIFEAERKEWLCTDKNIYWVYNASPLKAGFVYTCPLAVYDQTGSNAKTEIKISGNKAAEEIRISGPDTATIKENFVLLASAKGAFVFFSPKLGESKNSAWNITLAAAGSHRFYLYSNGALATKDVTIVEKKEFSVTAIAPKNVTLNGTFILYVTAENLLDKKTAKIGVDFDDEIIEKELTFAPRETKTIEFNITAAKTGVRKISAAALSDTISSYSTSILVYSEPSDDSILSAIIHFFSAIAAFLASLLPK